MNFVATLSFSEARECVIDRVRAAAPARPIETAPLRNACGRILAEDICADRDQPPLARSTRDGYAVRAGDVPGNLRLIGEVRAGESVDAAVTPGHAVEIMTGAPVPAGADAVVMIEHAQREGNFVRVDRLIKPGEFINPRGSEARRGDVVLPAGTRIGYAAIAQLAAVGRARVRVYVPPQVAIIATGDEIVPLDETPAAHQVRNSNAYSLAAQVARAGGGPEILPPALDTLESTRAAIEHGLGFNLLLLSGGVSAGKYDLVEPALRSLGAEFYFDRVLVQPGQPLVFGRAHGAFFFGLPGNPASTMVTFELFARPALEILAGVADPLLPILLAPLACDFHHKPGLTRFLPARLGADGRLTPVRWQGSSDIAALARANAFLVAEAGRESWKAGDLIGVLLK